MYCFCSTDLLFGLNPDSKLLGETFTSGSGPLCIFTFMYDYFSGKSVFIPTSDGVNWSLFWHYLLYQQQDLCSLSAFKFCAILKLNYPNEG